MTMKSAHAHEPGPDGQQAQALWFKLMQFYIREAWLLDERRFKEWLEIFTDDEPVGYSPPVGPEIGRAHV